MESRVALSCCCILLGAWPRVVLLADAAAQPAGAASTCEAVALDAMYKVLPGTGGGQPPPPPPVALAKPVAAARGELVHLQVYVAAGAVAVGAQISAAVDSLETAMIVRSLAYHNLTLPVAAANGIAAASRPGLFPDALIPLGAEGVLTQENMPREGAPQVFWLSLEVPRTAKPGLHQGRFNATGCRGASFSLQVSSFSMPRTTTQLTGAQFEAEFVRPFTSPACARAPNDGHKLLQQCDAPQTALNFFRSLATQHSNTQVWFQLDDLPWAPKYHLNAAMTEVTLNTTLNDVWWPRVLALTDSKHWRMPFSDRIHSVPHMFKTNATWTFSVEGANAHVVPMFQGGTAGVLNPEFSRLFKLLFGAVMQYLESRGWADDGSWVQVIDEPQWPDNDTLANTMAIMRLYKQTDPRIKIYQTRWPNGGGAAATELTASGVPPYALPLLDLVDWWCPHVCQWTAQGVPEAMAALRRQRAGTERQLHITVYDNGVPIIESPWERLRTQALDVWTSNGTLDGTLSWYSVNSYHLRNISGHRNPGLTEIYIRV
jgi:hypothetical protein